MKALKTFFAWILLIVLPVQGFAAVSMSLCEPGKAALVAAAATDRDGHGIPVSASAGDCGHHTATLSEDSAKDLDRQPDAAKCSTCAAGSVGASITTAFTPLPAFNTRGADAIPYVAAHDTACIYGAPERPPHTLA